MSVIRAATFTLSARGSVTGRLRLIAEPGYLYARVLQPDGERWIFVTPKIPVPRVPDVSLPPWTIEALGLVIEGDTTQLVHVRWQGAWCGWTEQRPVAVALQDLWRESGSAARISGGVESPS